MLDIGFFELLVVGVVLIIVMGPERLPEVAQKAAFLIRKARQGMFRLRNEMQNEIQGTPFADLEKAKQEMADLKNDLRQFGRDLADSAEKETNEIAKATSEIASGEESQATEMTGKPLEEASSEKSSDGAPDLNSDLKKGQD